MITAENTTSPALAASLARHELNLDTLRAMSLAELRHVDDALTTVLETLMALLNASRFGRGGYNSAGFFLDGVEEHLRTLRDAVVDTAEERAPRSAAEAAERASLLLLSQVRGGAALPEVAELLDRLAREREPALS